MGKIIRLACRIPQEAGAELDRAAALLNMRRGKAILALMALAKANPSFPVRAFADGGRESSCSIDVPKEWFDNFGDYRVAHSLYENTKIFRDALLRGLSVHIANRPTPRPPTPNVQPSDPA